MLVALGLVFLVSAALIGSRVMHLERAAGTAHLAETNASANGPQPAQTFPGQDVATDRSTAQPQTSSQPQQSAVPGENYAAVHASAGSGDPQVQQREWNAPAPHRERVNPPELAFRRPPVGPPPSPSPAESSAVPSGSDRYPGSQPVEVKDANLPDIGIPVASEVYTTSDPVSTVLDYYRQRYPEAEVMEVNGQTILAVNQPGATKVVAIGTTGQETRIAIVQPAQ